MGAVRVTDRSGGVHLLPAREGVSVMEIIRNANIDDTLGLCGGACSCATCHVYVAPAFEDRLPAMSAEEALLLEALEHRRPLSRLCCQLRFTAVLGELEVELAPEE